MTVFRAPGSPAASPSSASCDFCAIAAREASAHLVLDDAEVVAFLDRRPLFEGHTLVVPRSHVVELRDLDGPLRDELFARVQEIAAAVQDALGADGTFVATNNVVSQSVPHLHVHVVPRRFKDGLRGFFWPRTTYASDLDAAAVAEHIRAALDERRAARDSSGPTDL